MTILEAFEDHGTWDENGLAWVQGRRVPEMDLATLEDERGDDDGWTPEAVAFEKLGWSLSS